VTAVLRQAAQQGTRVTADFWQLTPSDNVTER
jgi:hypothetical protein